MLQAFDDPSSIIISEETSSFATWMRSLSDSYLSQNDQRVTITKTEGKYHLIELADDKVPSTLLALKTASYFTVILPLIALIIKAIIPRSDEGHLYFYEDQGCNRSLFLEAIKNRDLTTMKALYAFNKDLINDRDANESTALITACTTGDIEIVSWLLDHHVDISAANSYGQTPFLFTCYHGNLEIAKLLYKKSGGSVLDDQDNNKKTPFITACLLNDPSNLKTIMWLYEITEGAVLYDTDILGETGFMKICSQDLFEQLETAEWLYQKSKGSVLADRDLEGNTVFMVSCYARNFITANWLLEKSQQSALKDKDINGKTAFLRSCEEGFLDIAKWLYERSKGSVLKNIDNNGRTICIIGRNSDFLTIRQWLSEIIPSSGISKEITFNPMLSSHLPRQLYESCKIHDLFEKELQTKAAGEYESITLCYKEKADINGTSKLWISLEVPNNKNLSAEKKRKEEYVYLSYFPSDEQKYGFEKISLKFKEHRLLDVSIIHNGIFYEKPCLSWNTEQTYINLTLEDIFSEFID